jgi:hypothetical protein
MPPLPSAALASAPPSDPPPPQFPMRTQAMTHIGEAPGIPTLQIWPALQSASFSHAPEV